MRPRPMRMTLVIAATLLAAFFMVRPVLAGDGELDPAFDTDGIVVTSVAGTDVGDVVYDAYGQGTAIQSDGKILVAGLYGDGTATDYYYDVFVIRYCVDGSLDDGSHCGATGFGDGGIARVRVSTVDKTTISRTNILVLPGGEILLIGDLVGQNVFLVRFTGEGFLDTTFGGGDGIATLPLTAGIIRDCALLDSGKILAAGYDMSGGFSLLVVRINEDGSLDTSFGSGGITQMQLGGMGTLIDALAVNSDGSIVVGGYVSTSSPSYQAVFVARLTADGALDTGFSAGDGTDGYYEGDLSTAGDGITALAIQSDGKILAAGYQNSTPHNKDFFLLRLNAGGSLDSDFDGDSGTADGVVVTNVHVGINDGATEILLQEDGTIIVGGTYEVATNREAFTIVRYTTTGAIDTTFGTGGIVDTYVTQDAYNDDKWGQGKLSPTGKLIVAGAYFDPVDYYADVVVLCYDVSAGYVAISGYAGVGGATLSYDDGGLRTAIANSDGYYTVMVPSGWSGTITPALTGYTFDPITRTHTNVITDLAGQDYVATHDPTVVHLSHLGNSSPIRWGLAAVTCGTLLVLGFTRRIRQQLKKPTRRPQQPH